MEWLRAAEEISHSTGFKKMAWSIETCEATFYKDTGEPFEALEYKAGSHTRNLWHVVEDRLSEAGAPSFTLEWK